MTPGAPYWMQTGSGLFFLSYTINGVFMPQRSLKTHRLGEGKAVGAVNGRRNKKAAPKGAGQVKTREGFFARCFQPSRRRDSASGGAGFLRRSRKSPEGKKSKELVRGEQSRTRASGCLERRLRGARESASYRRWSLLFLFCFYCFCLY